MRPGEDSFETSHILEEGVLDRPIELALMGNLFMVKLLQFSMTPIACTLNIRSNQAQFGISKHVERSELVFKNYSGEEPAEASMDSEGDRGRAISYVV